MPQGSILCPQLFKIFINDLFLYIETTTLCNYADNNTMCSSDKNANIVISRFRHVFTIMSEWFYENYMVLKESCIKFVRKIFRKTNISNPLICTRSCAYQGVRNVSFSENFAYVLNG